MEDFKGYIFMIIAILSAIVSIYQKSKKKGQQSKPLSSPRPKPLEPWKDIFDTDDENNTTQTFGGDRYDESSIYDYKQEAVIFIIQENNSSRTTIPRTFAFRKKANSLALFMIRCTMG